MAATTAGAAAVPRTRTRKRRRSAKAKRDFFWGLVFTSPAIIGLLWFTAYPVLASLYYSFTNYTMVGKHTSWIGFTNYVDLIHDPTWWSSLWNTFYIVILSVPIGIIVALVLALLLNLKVRGQSIYRTIFFLPTIVPIVASAVVWSYVFDPQYGALNSALHSIGITGPGWLADPKWAKPALIIFGAWGVGNLMVIMLAGLQDVPRELHEAAAVDGAGVLTRFRAVTIPFLSPTLMFALVTGLIAGFQYFTPVFVLTGGAGTPAGSTLVSGLYLFQNAFQFFKVGYASAIAWVLFLLIAIITAVTFRIVGRRVYYGGE
ncbi:MAG TPA: sugar ABC transporter permease [Mycobacteriales bacterium]|jgi:multiple sugar transport system permease protein|nr:sugar ABC transporter permease [Mycobacteriales bacterium]